MQKKGAQSSKGYSKALSTAGPSVGLDQSLVNPRASVKRVVQQLDFKSHTGERYDYKQLVNHYLEKTQSSNKKPLDSFVTAIDDLGPELILNLRQIDVYRHPSNLPLLYHDLLQSILIKHCWENKIDVSKFQTTLNPDENDINLEDSDEEDNERVNDEFRDNEECPIRSYIESYFNMLTGGVHEFATHLRKAPFIFHILNQALQECCFSKELQQSILNYSKVFMSQPLPHSLLPLETNRIILNERLMPGITKVLLIAQDFPMLNLSPNSPIFKEVYKLNIINQLSQIFVYEDIDNKQRNNNRTLSLITALQEHPIPTMHEMHGIRKEFLKKVFANYIKQIPVKGNQRHISKQY